MRVLTFVEFDAQVAGLNPTPVLESLSQSTVAAGSDTFTLTLTGSGFISSSQVKVNGVNRATSFVDDETLEIDILDTEITTTGLLSINVTNDAPGGGESASLELEIVPADSDFANVTALLHFDGTDSATTFTDVTGKTWTGAGNAQLDTADKKYGTASALFDGTGDKISTASDAGFGFGTGDYTIECWVKANNFNGKIFNIFDTRTASNTGIALGFMYGLFGFGNNVIYVSSNSTIIAHTSNAVAGEVWLHIALTRAAGTLRAFVNGVKKIEVTDSRTYAAASTCVIGWDYAGTGGAAGTNQAFAGHIDDFRVTKGVARYTADFTPPTAAFPDI